MSSEEEIESPPRNIDFVVEVMDEFERSVLWMKEEMNKEEFDTEQVVRVCDHLMQCCLLLEGEVNGFEEFEEVRRVLDEIREFSYEARVSEGVIERRGRGRPEVSVSCEQIEFYLEHGFSIEDIAKMYACSRRTIERRMKTAGISVSKCYSTIGDGQLLTIVQDIVSRYPRVGEKILDGMLRAQNIRVQRHRIRECLYTADPTSCRLRLQRALHRREYSVDGSNALWHVDGYHKLIRWRIVVHGGVDGYSRVVLYLRAATNNRSDTALEAFMHGIHEYGLPSRVRTDKGGKNTGIAEYMLSHRGTGRGSIITGRSVHNQRVERLWRDLFSGCVSYFYYLFYAMESEGVLQITEEVDMYALHFVFLPKLQKQLDMFRQGWCHHRLRTEGNKTPNQLWIMGFSEFNNARCIDGLDVSLYDYVLILTAILPLII